MITLEILTMLIVAIFTMPILLLYLSLFRLWIKYVRETKENPNKQTP